MSSMLRSLRCRPLTYNRPVTFTLNQDIGAQHGVSPKTKRKMQRSNDEEHGATTFRTSASARMRSPQFSCRCAHRTSVEHRG